MSFENCIKHLYFRFFIHSVDAELNTTHLVVYPFTLIELSVSISLAITLYIWRGSYWCIEIGSQSKKLTSLLYCCCCFGLPRVGTERTESTRFPGQHMFDHQGPSPLMNNSHNLHHQQQLPSQGHMGFGPPGPAFNQPGQGPLGLFPREPPRPNLPPHQGHQGMVGLNQQGGPPNQPRPFMGPRQPFGQQGNLFPPPQVQFGMQVRLRVSDFYNQ